MTTTTSPLALIPRPEAVAGAGRRTWSRRTSFRLAIATQVLVLAASNFPTPLFPIQEAKENFDDNRSAFVDDYLLPSH